MSWLGSDGLLGSKAHDPHGVGRGESGNELSRSGHKWSSDVPHVRLRKWGRLVPAPAAKSDAFVVCPRFPMNSPNDSPLSTPSSHSTLRVDRRRFLQGTVLAAASVAVRSV